MAALVDYCLDNFPGPRTRESDDNPAAALLGQVVERLADLAASWMVAGFVHGVLNTDNMNISGESFDYGPWRFLPRWDAGFTAAYFDHAGLYAFGRQPEALHWNCSQLAMALRLLSEAPSLIAEMQRFGPLYMEAIGRRWCWRLGVESRGADADSALVAASERFLVESGMQPDAFFFRHRGARDPEAALAEALQGYGRLPSDHPYWADETPQSMLIEEVETIWAAIAERDDWTPLKAKIAAIRRLGEAHGPPPKPQGHTTN